MPKLEPTRRADERALAWVKLRASGKTIGAIASQFGLSDARVYQITEAVKREDLIESKEPVLSVLRFYWTGRNRK